MEVNFFEESDSGIGFCEQQLIRALDLSKYTCVLFGIGHKQSPHKIIGPTPGVRDQPTPLKSKIQHRMIVLSLWAFLARSFF